jgi:hypothetical protein
MKRSVATRAMAGLLLIGAWLAAGNAEAAKGFFVRGAGAVLINKVYHLDAVVDYQFSDEALQALQKGMPLTVALDIEILRNRDYLWSKSIAELHQRYQLRYETLTHRYIVSNLNSGAETSYLTREAALFALGHITGLPLIDQQILENGQEYTARLRAYLDAEELPVPLRLLGYISSAWNMSSEWYSWSLQ